ncbi:MAG: indolepyruvate oxidoreductase subunit beta [Firmicutes bacterium]|nr:indolepyruvate oxidoreductase subunit beta [Dethiobacter sp.]MBS3888884.1 indolepyruvate oxidoreductase subunit beta [Bacillota bacterium]MBS4054308.1 indolepyruvate oxidoreductase subunit beta [Thermaerobacter sp.]
MTTNILIAGVGGQGLVLTTRVISMVALQSGFDVKTTDVIGLAQRGGMVWGSVRFGQAVHSPLIPKGDGDFLLGLEMLEGLRWASLLKPASTVILSRETIYPSRVLLEKEPYPADIPASLTAAGLRVVCIDAHSVAEKLGNLRLANTVLLGALSTCLPLPAATWLSALESAVPKHTVELNHTAFQEGASAFVAAT